NKQERTVLFDFIDSNEYRSFTTLLNVNYGLNHPSMVLLNNYTGRTIQENTIYAIQPKIIQSWINQNLPNSENSFLIGYKIDVTEIEEPIFKESVSMGDSLGRFHQKFLLSGGRGNSEISFPRKGEISVIVRNVGQGNWNEIRFSDKVKIVYDAGASSNASRTKILA